MTDGGGNGQGKSRSRETQLTLPIRIDDVGERRLEPGWIENELQAPEISLCDEERRLAKAVAELGRVEGGRVIHEGNQPLADAIGISTRQLQKWAKRYCRPGLLNYDRGRAGLPSRWTLFLLPIYHRDIPESEPERFNDGSRRVDDPRQMRLAFERPPLWWRLLAWFVAAIRPGTRARVLELPESQVIEFQNLDCSGGGSSRSQTPTNVASSGTQTRGDPEVPASPHEYEFECESEDGPSLNSTQESSASGKPLAGLNTAWLQAAIDAADAHRERLIRESIRRYRLPDDPETRAGILAAARQAVDQGKPPPRLFRYLVKGRAWQRAGELRGIPKECFEVASEQPTEREYDVNDW